MDRGTLIVVDARNVQRSMWPNASDLQLVRAAVDWRSRQRTEHDLVLCFDGEPAGCDEWSGSLGAVQLDASPYADDRIVEIVREAVAAGFTVEVATSDRELRRRIDAAGGSTPWGGGAFARLLGLR